LGIEKSSARIQSLWENETNVWFGFHEQLATSSWQQSMANWIEEPQLKNMCTTPSKIYVGDEPFGTICIDKSLTKEVAKKCQWSRR
jgi:hypothetical protein